MATGNPSPSEATHQTCAQCGSVGVGASESRPWGAAAQVHPPPWPGLRVGLEVSAVHRAPGGAGCGLGFPPLQAQLRDRSAEHGLGPENQKGGSRLHLGAGEKREPLGEGERPVSSSEGGVRAQPVGLSGGG